MYYPGQTKTVIFLLLVLAVSACDIKKQKDVEEGDAFLKVYNHSNTNLVFYPLSVLETDDRGFLMLNGVKNDTAGNTYPYANLIKTNETGAMEWSVDIGSALSPVAGLFPLNGNYGFLAMNEYESAYLYEIDKSNGNVLQSTSLNFIFPLLARKDAEGNVLVLSVEPGTPATRILKFNNDFSVLLNTADLPVGSTQTEADIYRHAYKTGRELAFFAGEMSLQGNTGYFVNCYYNATLRTVFFDNVLTQLGNLYSFQQKDYIAALVQKSDSLFAFIEQEEGRSILHGHQALYVFNSKGTREMSGMSLKGIADYYPVIRSTNLSIDDKEYTVFASSSNSNDLVLYHISDTASTVADEITVSFDDEVELRDMLQTQNGDVVLLSEYFVNGKYVRPALRKINISKFDFE